MRDNQPVGSRSELLLPTFDVLLATLCYLMTRYALNPSGAVARAVSRHFSLLEQHPDCHSSELRKVARRLERQWHQQALFTPQQPSDSAASRIPPDERRH